MTYFAENRRDLRCDGEVFLLNEMRRLVLHVSGNVLFGDKGLELARYIQVYFEQRRHLSDGGQAALASRRELVRTGIQIDRKLRARLAQLRSEVRISEVWDPCLLALLSEANIQNTSDLTDDELIAHGNVLFMSSSEPIAVSLTWTLLLLSQRDDLRRAIRKRCLPWWQNTRLFSREGTAIALLCNTGNFTRSPSKRYYG
jgi:cytochrome P450